MFQQDLEHILGFGLGLLATQPRFDPVEDIALPGQQRAAICLEHRRHQRRRVQPQFGAHGILPGMLRTVEHAVEIPGDCADGLETLDRRHLKIFFRNSARTLASPDQSALRAA